jgi:xylulokinase
LEAEEGGAFGAAILAGVGAKVWPSVDDACRAAIRVACKVIPNDDAIAIMNESYAAYQRVYAATRSIYQS